MNKLFPFILIIVFIVIMSYTGCKDQITGSDIDSRVIPDSNVSYSQDIQPFFNIKCANAGCHNDTERAGGISLTSCANTTADPSIVFPGEPDNSRLVWAIEGISNFPMPPVGYPPLTSNQIRGVRTWIQEGAKCN